MQNNVSFHAVSFDFTCRFTVKYHFFSFLSFDVSFLTTLAHLESTCSLNEGVRKIWGNVLFFMRINDYGKENNRRTCLHVFHGSFLSSTNSQTMRIPPLL